MSDIVKIILVNMLHAAAPLVLTFHGYAALVSSVLERHFRLYLSKDAQILLLQIFYLGVLSNLKNKVRVMFFQLGLGTARCSNF